MVRSLSTGGQVRPRLHDHGHFIRYTRWKKKISFGMLDSGGRAGCPSCYVGTSLAVWFHIKVVTSPLSNVLHLKATSCMRLHGIPQGLRCSHREYCVVSLLTLGFHSDDTACSVLFWFGKTTFIWTRFNCKSHLVSPLSFTMAEAYVVVNWIVQ